MPNLGTALLGISALQAGSSIAGGYAQSAEDKYNANISSIQAQDLGIQGQITQGQYTRAAGQMLSKQTATSAAMGLEPTGSVAAVMVSSQTQIETDAAIAKFNNSQAINAANAQSTLYKQKAAQDVFSGYSSAFSDMLTGVSNYAMYKQKQSLNLNSGAGGSMPLPESPMG
jgi:hypothetical protein